MSSTILSPLLVTITLISFSVYYFFFSNNKAAIGTKTTATTSTTTTTVVVGNDDEATADQEETRNFGIGDGEELIEGTVTLTLGGEATEEEEEEKEDEEKEKEKKIVQQKEDNSATSSGLFDLGGLLGETMEKIKINKKKENENVLTNTEVVDDEKKEEDDDTKTKDRNKDVISYYHQAATNRKPGVEIHHIVLLHGQRFTKENWKTSGILSMFNRQFPSIAVTACNLTTTGLGGDDSNNNHYLLLDLLDKLEEKGVISLPLSGLVTPSASGKTITDWLCEQIVDDDDDSTVASVDEDEEEDDKKDDKKVETEADEKEEVDDDKDDEAVEEEEDSAAKDEDEENDKKVDDDDDNNNNNNDAGKENENENEDNTQKKKKIKIPLNKLLQYVRRWIPVASYNVMNCTKNQLRLLGAFTVCGEGEDNNNNNNETSDDEKQNKNNKLNINNKKFNIVAIYGNQDQGGAIVSKRLENYSYATVKELNGRHPVYLDSPDEFVPAIGWSIIL